MAFANEEKTQRRTYKVLSLSKATYLLSRKTIELALAFALFSNLKERRPQDSTPSVSWFVDQHHSDYRRTKPNIRTIHRRAIYHLLACHWDNPSFQEDLIKHRILTKDQCQEFHEQVNWVRARETGSKWGVMRIANQEDVNKRSHALNRGTSAQQVKARPKVSVPISNTRWLFT